MAPLAERMSRARAIEREKRRKAENASRPVVNLLPTPASVSPLRTIDPAERQGHREERASRRRAMQKAEAERIVAAHAVEAAADAFIRAIVATKKWMALCEARGINPDYFGHPPPCFDPPLAEPIPGIDATGRALFIMMIDDGDGDPEFLATAWRHMRRSRIVATMTARERKIFIEAVRANSDVATSSANAARFAFARAMRDATARDREHGL